MSSQRQYKVGDTVTIRGRQEKLAECLSCKSPIALLKTDKVNQSTGKSIWEKLNPDSSAHQEPQKSSDGFQKRAPTFKQWASFSTEWTDSVSGLKRTCGLTIEYPAEINPQDCFDRVQYEVMKFIGRQLGNPQRSKEVS